MWRTLLLVAIGGGIGSILRYLTTVAVQKYYSHAFPLATFLINFAGCFLIGLAAGFMAKHPHIDQTFKWFFITGF